MKESGRDQIAVRLRAELDAVSREITILDVQRDTLTTEADRLRAALAAVLGLPGITDLVRRYIAAGPGPYTAREGSAFARDAGWRDEYQGDAMHGVIKTLGRFHRAGELIVRDPDLRGVYRRLPGSD